MIYLQAQPSLSVTDTCLINIGRLTKASKVRKLCRIVRHCAHEPIRGCLPHRVEQAAEDV